MFRIPTVPLVAAVVSLCVAALIATVSTASDKPRLILQITVDQLRGDFIDRYSAHIGEGGFRSLQEHAVTFSNAHHRHANNETIVGHTTLSTGTDPAIDGIHGSEKWLRFSSRNIVDRQRFKTRAISSTGTFACLQRSILRRSVILSWL